MQVLMGMAISPVHPMTTWIGSLDFFRSGELAERLRLDIRHLQHYPDVMPIMSGISKADDKSPDPLV
jgi:hypothetical protein